MGPAHRSRFHDHPRPGRVMERCPEAFAPAWARLRPPPAAMGLRPYPEILAPAGAHDSLSAALAAGADAVYFGLDDGFNARARATNFASDALAETIAWIH